MSVAGGDRINLSRYIAGLNTRPSGQGSVSPSVGNDSDMALFTNAVFNDAEWDQVDLQNEVMDFSLLQGQNASTGGQGNENLDMNSAVLEFDDGESFSKLASG